MTTRTRSPIAERLQTRLLLARHARFGFAEIENHVWPFDPLDRGVDDFVHASDVFVVNRVPLGFAHLLENYLLGELGGDASQNSFGDFRILHFPADFEGGIDFASIFQT